MLRRIAVIVASILLATACTSGENDANGDAEDSGTTSTGEPEITTTTDPPIILALTPSLGLVAEQCWAEIPEATTTTTIDLAVTSIVTFEDAVPTAPETLPETVPTLPKPPTVAIVACDGTNAGRAFAGFCLIEDLASENDRLTGGPCDQPSELEWPGDRAVRRAAARICLQRFEEFFGESYADSELVAREFTPTEGVWQQGDRRVVCTVNNPEA